MTRRERSARRFQDAWRLDLSVGAPHALRVISPVIRVSLKDRPGTIVHFRWATRGDLARRAGLDEITLWVE